MEDIEIYINVLKELNIKKFVLLHDAALHAYNSSNNVTCDPFDILLKKEDYVRLKSLLSITEESDEYFSIEYCGGNFRFWKSIAGFSYDSIPKRYIDGIEVPEPKLLLDEILEESPELYLLVEQRARFASIVYFNEMSDEEINLFRRYVRQT